MSEHVWTIRRHSRRAFLHGLSAAAGLAALAPLAACSSSKRSARGSPSAATAGASPNAGSSASPAASAARPLRGGTLTLAMASDPTTLDLLKYFDVFSAYAIRNMADTLVRYTHDLQPAPGLAKSWEISPDGTEYVFHLQPNVSFHDVIQVVDAVRDQAAAAAGALPQAAH